MLNSVNANYFGAVQFKGGVNPSQPQVTTPQTPINQPINMVPQQKEVASKEQVEALKSYVAPKIVPFFPVSPEQFVENLKRQGKVEGKDFEVKKTDQFTDVVEFNKEGKDGKISFWENVDGKQVYRGSDEHTYRGDRNLSTISKDEKGHIKSVTHHYYNDETRQDVISHDGLTYETKIDDYVAKLEKEGVKFNKKVETDKWGDKNIIVEVFDANGKESHKTVWVINENTPEKNYLYREFFNKDGKTSVSVYMDEEKSAVTQYPKSNKFLPQIMY